MSCLGMTRSDDNARRSPQKAIPSRKSCRLPTSWKAIEASKQGKTAAVDGYRLATITKKDFTGWRFYTGMPDQDVLKHDMAEALDGGGTPIFQNGADGKTSLFAPKS
jgi:hypothetical protein